VEARKAFFSTDTIVDAPETEVKARPDWTIVESNPARKSYPWQWYSYKRWIKSATPPLFQLQFAYDFNQAKIKKDVKFKFNCGYGWVLTKQLFPEEHLIAFRDFSVDDEAFIVGILGVDHNLWEIPDYIEKEKTAEVPAGIKSIQVFSNKADFLRPFVEEMLIDFPGWSNIEILSEGSMPTYGGTKEAGISGYWMTHVMGILPKKRGRVDQPVNSNVFF